LYIEVGRISQQKAAGFKRVRDKSIKVKLFIKVTTRRFTSNNINVKYKLQLMKKIYNIIDSELILRTNNHRLRQEFGEVAHQKVFLLMEPLQSLPQKR
jgi:hypothetical protein